MAVISGPSRAQLAALQRAVRWYGNSVIKGARMARKSQEHADTLLTWSVGLMGAGLFALPAFLTSTCGSMGLSVPLLASPWGLGIVLALVGRVFGGLRRDTEDTYLARKSAALEVFMLTLLEASANQQTVSPQVFTSFGESVLIIMNDKDPQVAT
jgi:hypothetical protein